MGPSIISAAEVIRRSQAEAMERLLEAWDHEIEEAFADLRRRQGEINQELTKRAIEAQREYSQELQDQALNASLGPYLEGLANAAEDNPSIAAPSLPAAQMTTLSDLIGDVRAEVLEGQTDSPLFELQQSLADQIDRGFVPHPGDVAALLTEAGLDTPAYAFATLAERLEQASSTESGRSPALQFHGTQSRATVLQDEVRLLGKLGAETIVALICDPKSAKAVAGQQPVAKDAVDRALDAFLTRGK